MKVKKTKDKFFQGVLVLLFLSLLALAGVLVYKLLQPKPQTPIPQVKVNDADWEEYYNAEYAFMTSIPRYLYKREVEGKDGYLIYFVFGQTNFSRGSGVAIAISERSLSEEVEVTKREYEKSGEASLVSEKEVFVGAPFSTDSEIAEKGEKGIRLSYRPKNEESGLVARDVIISSHQGKTFVINSAPKEIDYILQQFKFL